MTTKLVSKSKDGTKGEIIVTREGKAPVTVHVNISPFGKFSPVGLREGRGAMFESPSAAQRAKEDYKAIEALFSKPPAPPEEVPGA